MGSGGKRRHQHGPEEEEDPSCLSSSSSSSCSSLEGDREESSPKEDFKCSHASGSVSKSKVHKAIRVSYTRIGGVCVTCKRLKVPDSSSVAREANQFFMCLACGQQFCEAHKDPHFKASRTSPSHCIFLELSSWALRCELCEANQTCNLSPDSSKRLRDVFELVKRAKNQKKKGLTSLQSNTASSSNQVSAKLPKVRGLTNLGNTCFFNAIMQCLTQSHPLLHYLDLHSQRGAPFKTGKILGGDVLNLQLEDAGPLTLSLAAFLKEMNSLGGKSVAFNPSQLFGRISHRSPQFRGFHQEDSHELLRHLMEGVKTEEVARQKTSVLKYYGLTDKASRTNLGAILRKKLQSCNRYTNYTIVDKLFGGHLVSTILCEVCHNSSQIFEPFLDLSLPLIEEKPSRSNKFEDDESGSSLSCFGTKKNNGDNVSKSKKKKDKKLAKKEMRKSKKNKKTSFLEEIEEKVEDVKEDSSGEAKENPEDSPSNNHTESQDPTENPGEGTVLSQDKIKVGKLSQSLVNNLSEDAKSKSGPKAGPKDGNEEDDEDDDQEGSGNDDDWEWCTDSQDQEEKKEPEVEGDAPEVAVNTEVQLNFEPHQKLSDDSGDSSNADVEDNIESGCPKGNDRHRSFSISQLSYHPDPLHLDPRMQELSRNVRRLSVQASAFEDISEKALQEYTVTSDDNGNIVEEEDMRVQNDWIARSLTSIAPRYTSRSAGECSVYSCLAQFTSPELLTGNNKWACEKCTRNQSERRNERSSSSPETDASSDAPKTVYSNASKQLSIFCPPFILTIHLKRFQQTMCSLRKINKHVDFPLILDLAPFCSSAAVSMPTVAAGQESVKYYLFGLVCHSGRLHGGHYTAYVKVRPRDCSKDFSRFYSSPAVKNDEINDLLEEIERKFEEYSASAAVSTSEHVSRSSEEISDSLEGGGDPPLEPYKWFHVSDSMVTEVSEDRVLKSQAYILFYERFL